MWTFGFYFKEILSTKIKTANIFFHFLLFGSISSLWPIQNVWQEQQQWQEQALRCFTLSMSMYVCVRVNVFFFLKPELTSSLCVWVCVDKTHSGINSRVCECWRFVQLCMSLSTPLQPLHSWKQHTPLPSFSPTILRWTGTHAQRTSILSAS